MVKKPTPLPAASKEPTKTVLDLRQAVYSYDRALLWLWRDSEATKDLETFEDQRGLALYEASRDSGIPMETIQQAWLIHTRSEAVRAEGRLDRSLNYEE